MLPSNMSVEETEPESSVEIWVGSDGEAMNLMMKSVPLSRD